ncbi:MAG: iron donor protein CyaY [Burkholderiaceae bacterium]
MTDTQYQDRAEAALRAIELACDRINETSDVDLDNQRTGGMVTLTFANRSQIVVNLQKPLHEIWMAARSGGFHFKWSGSAWVDTKGAGELFALLTQFTSEQAGQPLVFAADTGGC